ncbi:MAG: hypothetical protein ACK5GO_07120 [Ignavibacteria bacterium]|jgi:hypothetical protein
MTCKQVAIFLFFIFVIEYECIGQIKTKQGLKIDLYMNGEKKPIKLENLEDHTIVGATGRYHEFLEKIVIYKKKDQYVGDLDISIRIYEMNVENSDSILLMRKDISEISFENNKNTYTLYVYPWIDMDREYQILIKEADKVLLKIPYRIGYWSGY